MDIFSFRYNGNVKDGKALVLPTNATLLRYRHQTMRFIHSRLSLSETHYLQISEK